MSEATIDMRTMMLNRLLRGELAAVDTYRQALEMMPGGAEGAQLESILEEHEDSCFHIRENVAGEGGEPDDNSGAWGAWATFVEGTAKIFGRGAALRALKAGEEHGIGEYRRALDDRDVPHAFKTLIRTELLPRSLNHVALLDWMILEL